MQSIASLEEQLKGSGDAAAAAASVSLASLLIRCSGSSYASLAQTVEGLSRFPPDQQRIHLLRHLAQVRETWLKVLRLCNFASSPSLPSSNIDSTTPDSSLNSIHRARLALTWLDRADEAYSRSADVLHHFYMGTGKKIKEPKLDVQSAAQVLRTGRYAVLPSHFYSSLRDPNQCYSDEKMNQWKQSLSRHIRCRITTREYLPPELRASWCIKDGILCFHLTDEFEFRCTVEKLESDCPWTAVSFQYLLPSDSLATGGEDKGPLSNMLIDRDIIRKICSSKEAHILESARLILDKGPPRRSLIYLHRFLKMSILRMRILLLQMSFQRWLLLNPEWTKVVDLISWSASELVLEFWKQPFKKSGAGASRLQKRHYISISVVTRPAAERHPTLIASHFTEQSPDSLDILFYSKEAFDELYISARAYSVRSGDSQSEKEAQEDEMTLEVDSQTTASSLLFSVIQLKSLDRMKSIYAECNQIVSDALIDERHLSVSFSLNPSSNCHGMNDDRDTRPYRLCICQTTGEIQVFELGSYKFSLDGDILERASTSTNDNRQDSSVIWKLLEELNRASFHDKLTRLGSYHAFERVSVPNFKISPELIEGMNWVLLKFPNASTAYLLISQAKQASWQDEGASCMFVRMIITQQAVDGGKFIFAAGIPIFEEENAPLVYRDPDAAPVWEHLDAIALYRIQRKCLFFLKLSVLMGLLKVKSIEYELIMVNSPIVDWTRLSAENAVLCLNRSNFAENVTSHVFLCLPTSVNLAELEGKPVVLAAKGYFPAHLVSSPAVRSVLVQNHIFLSPEKTSHEMLVPFTFFAIKRDSGDGIDASEDGVRGALETFVCQFHVLTHLLALLNTCTSSGWNLISFASGDAFEVELAGVALKISGLADSYASTRSLNFKVHLSRKLHVFPKLEFLLQKGISLLEKSLLNVPEFDTFSRLLDVLRAAESLQGGSVFPSVELVNLNVLSVTFLSHHRLYFLLLRSGGFVVLDPTICGRKFYYERQETRRSSSKPTTLTVHAPPFIQPQGMFPCPLFADYPGRLASQKTLIEILGERCASTESYSPFGIKIPFHSCNIVFSTLTTYMSHIQLFDWLISAIKASYPFESLEVKTSTLQLVVCGTYLTINCRFSLDGKWMIGLEPCESKLGGIILTLDDCFMLSQCLESMINQCQAEELIKKGLSGILDIVLLLPPIALRDLAQVARLEFGAQTTSAILKTSLCFINPDVPSLTYITRERGGVCFSVEPVLGRMKVLLKYQPISDLGASASDNEAVYIPIKYNYRTGIIGIWKPDPDDEDLTQYESIKDSALQTRLAARNQTSFLQSLRLPVRVVTQASMRTVKPSLGGPGKLFVVAKHMSTKNKSELRL